MSFTNRIKRIRDNILFRHTVQDQPMHTTHITHTWGGVQLRKVAWDSYVLIPTFFSREISNDKFAILELVLLIASKRQVTRYPRVIIKEKQT